MLLKKLFAHDTNLSIFLLIYVFVSNIIIITRMMIQSSEVHNVTKELRNNTSTVYLVIVPLLYQTYLILASLSPIQFR